jgi:hypothetical protein
VPESWLERELACELRAVAAPEELWDRIQSPPAPRRENSPGVTWWPVAAALAVMIAGTTAWQVLRSGGDAESLDFRSDDPAAIGGWVKQKTDLALALPPHGGQVRILGARLVEREGAPAAAIAYRIGDVRATLFVARARRPSAIGDRTAGRHRSAKTAAFQNGSFSWSARDQVYTLVSSAKDPQIACLLCHANIEHPTAFN